MQPRGVIITRPEPGLSESAADVARLGWVPVLAPALHVRQCVLTGLPKQSAAVVLTSGQAVAAAAQSVALSVPVFAVGNATAHKARMAGFTTVWSAQGNAQDLAAMLVRQCAPVQGSLLLLSGAGQGVELAASLRVHGFAVVRRVAYRTAPVVECPESVCHGLQAQQLGTILFFSARSAQSWLNMVRQSSMWHQLLALRAVVISAVVAQTLHKAGWTGPVQVAARPDAPAMLAALGRV
ncbi:uroporphyrinogen-III synthase [Acetobacter syzygii]|uniref:Uroporphyrinogen-III synthase n=1 Tax=Acetobacter syzygii TaxID=146476 RepID=A0A270BTE6_9PROT|nr:uroporphyrinogen-III synthase [Acetobacter syzygii]PAL28114.1 hypothetical protein B9K05_02080 [Acetobacter syzygii]PAL28546.1 hypothetical protein B9K04_00070 [Acetobacter syzygii]